MNAAKIGQTVHDRREDAEKLLEEILAALVTAQKAKTIREEADALDALVRFRPRLSIR